MSTALPADSGAGTPLVLEQALLSLSHDAADGPAAPATILAAGGRALRASAGSLWVLGDGAPARVRWPGGERPPVAEEDPSPADLALLRERGPTARTRPGAATEVLDVPVWREREVRGVLRYERPAPAGWSAAERLFAVALAERVAASVPGPASGAFLELVQGLDAIVWEMEVERFAFTFVSRGCEHILGYPAEQWLAEPDFWQDRLLHPDDRDWAVSFCRTATRERRDHELEYRVIRADGEVVWLRDLVRVVRDGAGQPVLLRGVMIDVSRERRALRVIGSSQEITAQRASEESYRTIFEGAADAIYILHPGTGAILDANPAACELNGYPLDELKRLGIGGVSGGEFPFTWENALSLIHRAAAGEPQRLEWLARHRSGRPVWGDVTLRLVRILGRDRVLATARDITERKAAEESLQRVNAELESRVEERAAELAAANRALECEIAEHRTARREIQEREEHFRRLIENASDMVQLLDATGRIVYTGPSVVHLLGYTPDEIAGTDPMQYIHPDDLPETTTVLGEMLSSPGTVRTARYRVRHKDGHYRHFEAVARTLAPDSAAGGVVVNARDVTERHATEKALRDSETRYRALIENAHDIVTILDLEGRVAYQSPQLQRVLGYAPEEMIGRSALDFVHPEDRDIPARALGRILDTPGTTCSTEYRFRHKDGSWRYLETFGRTLLPDSAEQGLVFNTRDITERREAAAELERQKAYFEQLITQVDHGIAVWDAAGRFEYMSPNGLTDPTVREWIVGSTHHEYCERRGLPASVADLRQRPLTAALESGRPTECEETIRGRDGAPLHLIRRYSPVLNEAGAVERVIGYSIDITERKRAEEALRQATEEAQRARELAERANRAKSEFLSRMSHELRTPMNSILGFAQLLDRASLSPEHKKGVVHILKAGRHLLQLINEVLEIARIESGRHSLSLEPVRLDTVLHEAVALVRPLAAQWRVDLEDGRWSCDIAFVHADRQRLTQVLLNLLANAVKYNRPGGRVRVSCQAAAEDGEPRVVIRVADTGRGIPADKVDQLFTPFARLGAEQSRVEGTGLGLALSQRLTDAMGGVLTLESTGGEGSVFRLELRGADDPAEAIEETAAAVSSLDGEPHREATILYVEDNLANLSLVETVFLSRPRWTILPALQGRLGMELARERVPDLILLDLHLPDVSGEEIFHQLRADPRTAAIPVVVISADATRRSVEQLLAAGADAYLTKPLDIAEFLATVERFLGENRPGAGALAGPVAPAPLAG